MQQFIKPVEGDDSFKNPEIDDLGIYMRCYENEDVEIKEVTKKIKSAMEKYKNKSFALLLRYNYRIEKYVEIFKKENINYQLIDNYSGEGNIFIEKLGTIIGFVAEPNNDRLMKVIEAFVDKELSEGEKLYINRCSVEELFYIDGKDDNKSILSKELLIIINKLKNLLDISVEKMNKFIIQIGDEFDFTLEELSIVDYVANFANIMSSEDLNFTLEDLAYELLRDKKSFNYFASLVYDSKGYEPQNGCVTITNCHKAKGLEWDFVFIPHMNSSDYPGRLSDKFGGEIYYLKNEYKNIETMLKAQLQFSI